MNKKNKKEKNDPNLKCDSIRFQRTDASINGSFSHTSFEKTGASVTAYGTIMLARATIAAHTTRWHRCRQNSRDETIVIAHGCVHQNSFFFTSSTRTNDSNETIADRLIRGGFYSFVVAREILSNHFDLVFVIIMEICVWYFTHETSWNHIFMKWPHVSIVACRLPAMMSHFFDLSIFQEPFYLFPYLSFFSFFSFWPYVGSNNNVWNVNKIHHTLQSTKSISFKLTFNKDASSVICCRRSKYLNAIERNSFTVHKTDGTMPNGWKRRTSMGWVWSMVFAAFAVLCHERAESVAAWYRQYNTSNRNTINNCVCVDQRSDVWSAFQVFYLFTLEHTARGPVMLVMTT